MFNLKDLSDNELMKLFREEKDKGTQLGWDAFNEIYSRYYDFMYTLCQKRFHDSAEAEMMFIRTWDAVKKRPTYNRQKHNTMFATWLAGIAKNVACDVDNQRIHGDILVEEAIGIEADVHDFDEEKIPEREDIELMSDGLNALPEREKEIMLTYMEYDTGNGQYLPRNIIKTLCDKFKTTSPNLRKIKERSLKFLKQYVESHR